MKFKSLPTWVAMVSMLATIAVVIEYRKHFPGEYTDSRADWGAFGDYLGGILNPFFALLNLLVLTYISVVVAGLEDERNKNDIANQKITARYSLQHDSLKALSEILEKVQVEVVKSEETSRLNLVFVRNELHAFEVTYAYLFPSMPEKLISKLSSKIIELSETARNIFQATHIDENMEALQQHSDQAVTLIGEYNDLKIELIKSLQNDISF